MKLPRTVAKESVEKLLAVIKDRRDQAIFLLLLRSRLRVPEVARLTLQDALIPTTTWPRVDSSLLSVTDNPKQNFLGQDLSQI